jgi:hypothetical protein
MMLVLLGSSLLAQEKPTTLVSEEASQVQRILKTSQIEKKWSEVSKDVHAKVMLASEALVELEARLKEALPSDREQATLFIRAINLLHEKLKAAIDGSIVAGEQLLRTDVAVLKGELEAEIEMARRLRDQDSEMATLLDRHIRDYEAALQKLPSDVRQLEALLSSMRYWSKQVALRQRAADYVIRSAKLLAMAEGFTQIVESYKKLNEELSRVLST